MIRPVPHSEPLLLNVREVAAILAVSESTVYALIRQRKLSCYRFGRCIRIHRDAITEYLDSQRVECTPAEFLNAKRHF
ncbi:Helix-turn-helix domain protein [Roseimaritima multifibrata]|uniref:Helix-turn-helix domain protein n=1 Tax=Roseimaritima multifibrata TaxID=1930274 RepID=A0A517MC90_9BACT|nr:Helix-turn-helix domain protein [Roseimaritima multifibrata]